MPNKVKIMGILNITPDSFYDLGQGLLDQIYDLQKSLDEEFGSKKIGLRKRKK